MVIVVVFDTFVKPAIINLLSEDKYEEGESQKKQHYVDNAEFLNQIIKYKRKVKEAEESGKAQTPREQLYRRVFLKMLPTYRTDRTSSTTCIKMTWYVMG